VLSSPRLLLMMLAASGCGGTVTSVTAPSAAKCAVSAQASALSFPAAGGSASVQVSANRDCAWSIATDATWITFASSREGRGDATVTYSVAPNTQRVERQAAMNISDTRLEIRQAAPPPPPPPPAADPSPDPAPPPPPAPAPEPPPGALPPPDPPPGPPPAPEDDQSEEGGTNDGEDDREGDDTPDPDADNTSGSIALTDRIAALSGACPSLRLTLGAGERVLTDRRTNFKQMRCEDLGSGQQIAVRGRRQPGGEILASKIEWP
jgi:outer membrane biosynthesis protein TonB